MSIFPIDKKNVNAEILAKITNSIVKEFGCCAKYDKITGKIDLTGEDSCKIVTEVVNNLINHK